VFYSLQDTLIVYDLKGLEIDLLILDRPWLSIEDFSLPLDQISKILDDNIEKEIYFKDRNKKILTEKAVLLKIYEFKNIYMDNYGDPITDKNNNLIGYSLSENKKATIETYYNVNNLLCNKVLIKDFDENSLSFKGDIITYWIDTKTEFGFIREYNKKKYYYDNLNNLFNVEISYTCSQFPSYKKNYIIMISTTILLT